uniref:Uncharacterized protein n=1 Tax=Rousettus aegyptiacus TaxID=9407 RepID=A0A7J8KAT8_ROUAE|nr:hypothetical protein HJG63_007854 [Rousettus aegyptiacus]
MRLQKELKICPEVRTPILFWASSSISLTVYFPVCQTGNDGKSPGFKDLEHLAQAMACSMQPQSQGSPTTGPQTGTGLWPARNQAAQQEVNSWQASEASSVFAAAPPVLASPPQLRLRSSGTRFSQGHQSLVPKRLRTAALSVTVFIFILQGGWS